MLTHIHPKLPMRDKMATRDFYIHKLGFRESGNADYEGYLMLEKDNVQIHFFEFKGLDPKENYGQVYIRTNDIEQLYQSMLDNNVSIHPAGHLETKPWQQKEFALLDPDNNLLTFGQNIVLDKGPFYHGTKADLKIGDLLTAGFRSNYKPEITMNHIYFTALGASGAAGLAAALAKGDGRERVYIVEPTGDFENDPNVTDKKFPGNPTRSYRSRSPLKIVGEVTDWVKITPEELQNWKERLANIKGDIIN